MKVSTAGLGGIAAAGSLQVSAALFTPRVPTSTYLSNPIGVCNRYYCIQNIRYGTPAQAAESPIFDSGSGVLWTSSHKYSSSASSTYKFVNQSFSICYDSGFCNNGDYIEESVRFTGSQAVILSSVDMGVSLTAGPNTDGIMGVGVRGGAFTETPGSRPGVLAAMKTFTGTMAYSLYEDPTSQYYQAASKAIQARVIFGGISPALYTGNLVQLPFAGTVNWYWLMVQQVTYQSGQVQLFAPTLNIYNMRTLVDSGTTQFVIPQSLADDMASFTGSTRNISATGLDYAYNCQPSLLTQPLSKTFSFTFIGGVTIKVPVASLGFIDSNGNCQLLVSISSSPNTSIFGSAFIRHAYVVFDPENNRIALAQAATPSTATQPGNAPVTAIGPGSQNLPFAKAPAVVYPALGGPRHR